MQSTLQALFRSTIAGVVVQGYRSSSVLLLTRVIWSSHADLSGSGPHKLIALPFNTEPALPLAAVSRSQVNNQPPSW